MVVCGFQPISRLQKLLNQLTESSYSLETNCHGEGENLGGLLQFQILLLQRVKVKIGGVDITVFSVTYFQAH